MTNVILYNIHESKGNLNLFNLLYMYLEQLTKQVASK